MCELKGMTELNLAVTKVLAPFGISKALLSDTYEYRYVDESVLFKLTEEIEDDFFNEFIAERFNYKCKYPFIISLLHEVGHHKANDEIEGAIYEFCIREKARICEEMETADEKRAKELEWQYFNLPDEIMATQWAVNYAIRHPKKIEKMWERTLIALKQFYEINEIINED